RYLKQYEGDSTPPAQRMFINRLITSDLNRCLELNLTDAFCGFKAYRSSALQQLNITNDGYAMPLQLWVQAAAAGLTIMEIPVPLIYLDLERTFGGKLDHAQTRLEYYKSVMAEAAREVIQSGGRLPEFSPCRAAAISG
ncbi:MAG: glycosyltransferase family 2 protein, partial [Planctomycetota bacterium]